MNTHPFTTRRRPALSALLLGMLAMPGMAMAQSAIIYGSVSNFDIANDTGRDCHGFEIQLDGVDVSQVPYSFSAERYGAPSVLPNAAGVSVRWESAYDAIAGSWAERTLPHTVSWFPGQCYQWNPATYPDSGCEHFGTGVSANATRVSARWLCEDPAHPGTLLPVDPPTAVPMPTYYVQPPAAANNPPELVVEVQAPEPAEAPELYGDAQWIQVFRTELPRALTLEELVADNPAAVPMNANQLESSYSIIQTEPVSGGNGKRQRKRSQGCIAPTTRAIVRRIEMYAFTGQYDPITHEALCADGLCNTPAPDELGELLSVQMSAANVQPDAIIVSKAGNGGGSVDSSDKLIACGSKCAQPYMAGTLVTLNAKAASGSSFAGWTGACVGTQSRCTVAANGAVSVGANFTLAASGGGGGGGGSGGGSKFTLQVGHSNPGAISGTPAGTDQALNCGSACSAKFNAGTTVTLTATAPAGKQFLNWSGACSGTASTCTVNMNSNLSAQANFSK